GIKHSMRAGSVNSNSSFREVPGTDQQPANSQSVQWAAMDRAVKAFEDAWDAGAGPTIEDHLPAAGPLRKPLLVELVHVDFERRSKAGQPVRVEEYLARFPELRDDQAV